MFRVGQRDAEVLEKEFIQHYREQMVAQDNYRICMHLLGSGHDSTPVSSRYLPQADPATSTAQEAIATSRQRYSRPREDVEQAIYAQWYPSFTLSFDG